MTDTDLSLTVLGSRLNGLQRVGYVAWVLAVRGVAVSWRAYQARCDLEGSEPAWNPPEAAPALEAGICAAIREGNAAQAMRFAQGWKRAWLEVLGPGGSKS